MSFISMGFAGYVAVCEQLYCRYNTVQQDAKIYSLILLTFPQGSYFLVFMNGILEVIIGKCELMENNSGT
jgi:hypothetical protein